MADGCRQLVQAAFQDERIVDILPKLFKCRLRVVDLFFQAAVIDHPMSLVDIP